MEGSRPPGDQSAFQFESATLLDEILLDHGRPHQQRILMRQQNVGDKLGNVIAGEIVPRLMLLHRSANHAPGGNPPMRAEDLSSQVADFADLVVRHDNDVLEAYVRSLLQRGLDVETLLLHLMAPAARRLGVLWEADEISFVEVTIGTSRLQQLLHTFTPALHEPRDALDRHVLFLPAPGEQHTFGLLMVADFFRKEGWQVRGGMALEAWELESLIAEQSFTLIGFSLSCETLINALCSTIKSVRRLSRNKSVLVIVGGRIFAQDPSLRPGVGADLVAADAREALELAESALRNVAPRRGSRKL